MGMLDNVFSLKGKTAVITGSARGIGYGIATALSKAGAEVVIWDMDKDTAGKSAESIKKITGNRVYSFEGDITKKENIKGYISDIASMCGKIDILVNNAGIQVRKPALEFTIDEWDRVITTHLTGSFLVAQAVVPYMIKNNGGRIINLGSLNCFMAVPNIIAYTSAKSGIAGLTRSMCVEWAQYNINTNAIAPGFVETELTRKLFETPGKRDWVMGRIPMKQLADPERDLGYLAVFLSSEASRYINGQVIYSDGGWMAS